MCVNPNSNNIGKDIIHPSGPPPGSPCDQYDADENDNSEENDDDENDYSEENETDYYEEHVLFNQHRYPDGQHIAPC